MKTLLPVTRYYGSKRKLVDKIGSALAILPIQYQTFLDLFGGSGVVSYYMLLNGKEVFYNDIFAFNAEIAKALMTSSPYSLSEDDARQLLQPQDGCLYDNYIEKYFDGIYYTRDENRCIDIVVQNIKKLPEDKQSSAYYVLFQSCMIKRPFNLFHRKNLDLRLNHTKSSFGNKTTWEQSFCDLFLKFTKELHQFQFTKPMPAHILNLPALSCNQHADLVYIDPPYFNDSGTSISYHSRYHFLEGLMNYNSIPESIDFTKKNLELVFNKNTEFEQKQNFIQGLSRLFSFHQKSIIVLSYTSQGFPTINDLETLLAKFKDTVEVISLGQHSFALNKNNIDREEVIIVGY